MPPNIYVELHSGFGNNIFQYALAVALQDNFGFKTYILPSRGNTHSTTNYQSLFTLVEHAVDEAVPKNSILINKKWYAFAWWDLKSMEDLHNVRLCGYYQNYQLFKSVVPSIARELLPIFDKMYGVPTWNPMSTGFIHVRRGDYILPHVNMYNLQMDYYNEAIDHIQCMNPGLKWIIVSDDIAWCKAQTWKTIYEPTFFDSPDELKVFWCMLNCKAAAIIANSTFGYWAALLSAHQVKSPVVCPRAWHLYEDIDMFPDEWILMGSKEKSLKIR